MEEKEREQLKERLLKMVVNEPRLESMPPMTMAEVMVNSMSKPNLEPLLDFISQEQNRAREEGIRDALEEVLGEMRELEYLRSIGLRKVVEVEEIYKKVENRIIKQDKSKLTTK